MSIKVGQEIAFTIDGKSFVAITSTDMSFTIDALETTNMQTAGLTRSHRAGRYNCTFNFEGLYNPDEAVMESFWGLLETRDTVDSVTMIFGGSTAGDSYATMEGFLSNLSAKAQDNAVATVSGTFTGTGEVTVTTVPT